MRVPNWVVVIGATALTTGCATGIQPVDASSLNTSGPELKVIQYPSGEQLAPIDVTSRDGLQDALRRFRDAVATAGGDFGKIDALTANFATSYSRATNCQGGLESLTCKRTKIVVVEISISGRAMRTKGKQ
jgi:hypothetical protein